MGPVSDSGRNGLFGPLFSRGAVGVSDTDWLQAMLDTEAALARAVERAGLIAPGSGAAVTAAASADRFDIDELGRAAVLAGNPVPPLVRALSALLPAGQREAVHPGATSQDIIDTAVMLLARRAIGVIECRPGDGGRARGAARARARRRRCWPGARCCSRQCQSLSGLLRLGG